MAKGNKKGYGKLLEAWEPPENAGSALGCIATTYTFDSVFFEEECISRFIQMQSDAREDGPIYLIEREEKLSSIHCASVLVDAEHCKGNRSLRWDLLCARVPRSILHAKISLLHWSNCVRLIIASANITKDGYRRNQELFCTLDFFEGSDSPISCLDAVIDYLKEISKYSDSSDEKTSPPVQRWNTFLDSVRNVSRSWGDSGEYSGSKKLRVYPVLSGPDRPDVLTQIYQFWPSGSPARTCTVTSPFFDPPGQPNVPSDRIWSVLSQRGAASVTYNVTAEEIEGEDSVAVHAPAEISVTIPQGRSQAEVSVKQISEYPDSEDKTFRPLHMKSIYVSNSNWHGHLIGSSNFTSSGLGLNDRPNLEANLLFFISEKGNKSQIKELLRGVPRGARFNKSLELRWKPKVEDEENDQAQAVLPKAFSQAIFRLSEGRPVIELTFDGRPPEGWALYPDTGSTESFYNEAAWKSDGTPEVVALKWKSDRPPSGFEVTWNGFPDRTWLPVNVDKSVSLPPPDELKDLPLSVLLNILSSARPLHQALRYWLRHKEENKNRLEHLDPHDPHKWVDTSAFLLQKTRRIGWALTALRQKLERPVTSQNALEWRLRGPVGVSAVSKAILREANSEEEKAFLMTELLLELSRVQPSTAPGCLEVSKVKKEIAGQILELKKEIMRTSRKSSPGMKKYIETAFSEVSA